MRIPVSEEFSRDGVRISEEYEEIPNEIVVGAFIRFINSTEHLFSKGGDEKCGRYGMQTERDYESGRAGE